MLPEVITPNSSKGLADLTQDPTDFAAIMAGKKEVTPPPAEKKENTVEKSQTPDPSKDHSQDNGKQIPDEKKPVENKTEKTVPINEAKQQPAVSKQLTPEQFAKREADKKITELGNEKKRLFMAAVDTVKQNPASLDNIAKYDQVQADAIVKEVYGFDSMDEWKSQTRIAELRETDPEKADTEERFARLEKSLKISEAQAKQQLEKTFFESVKIPVNSVDSDYIAVKDKLKYLDPTFVKKDYAAALVLAHSMHLGPSSQPTPEQLAQEKALNEQVSEGGNNGIETGKHAEQSSYDDAQTSFGNLVGAKL